MLREQSPSAARVALPKSAVIPRCARNDMGVVGFGSFTSFCYRSIGIGKYASDAHGWKLAPADNHNDVSDEAVPKHR